MALVRGGAGWLIRGRMKSADHRLAFPTDYSLCTRQGGLNHAVVRNNFPNPSSSEQRVSFLLMLGAHPRLPQRLTPDLTAAGCWSALHPKCVLLGPRERTRPLERFAWAGNRSRRLTPGFPPAALQPRPVMPHVRGGGAIRPAHWAGLAPCGLARFFGFRRSRVLGSPPPS